MRLSGVLMLACSVIVTACGGGGGSALTNASVIPPPTTTETFTGTLSPNPNGFRSHNFTVAVAGTVTLTLTSAGPPATITIGIGIGTPITQDPGCAVISGVQTMAGSAPQMTGTAAAVPLCILVFDVGNLATDIDYSVTVVHP